MKKFALLVLVLIGVLSGGGAYWYYQVHLPDAWSPAAPQALAAMESDARVIVTRDRWIEMRPATGTPTTGLIFYPGGECAPEGYAEPLRRVAGAGVLVVNVPMPFALAILAPDRAQKVIDAHPEIEHWVIAGHSVGGTAAARFVYRHPDAVDGLLLWDSYAAEGDDLTRIRIPVRQLHRTDAQGKAPDSYLAADHLLPPQTERVKIAGASHLQYGRFVAAPRFVRMGGSSLTATISAEQQHDSIVVATLDFLVRIAENGGRT